MRCQYNTKRKETMNMAVNNKHFHLTLEERKIIETGIRNGSSKSTIAKLLGKDKSTIGKEIKLHRVLSKQSAYPIPCNHYAHCKKKKTTFCNPQCSDYDEFKCKRRDRSPGACNGCSKMSGCRHEKYKYIAYDADSEYKETLVGSRLGVNATKEEIKKLGEFILPLLNQGHSPYTILSNHPEIKICERTLYNYIEDGVFTDAGVPINCLNLKLQPRRRIPKKQSITYSPRKERKYLIGRKYKDYEEFMIENPNATVVQMDTVYNDTSNGPFLQTFKFIKYDLLFCIYHEIKDAKHMYEGILLLESILGPILFSQEVMVILTDRGSEFTLAEEIEHRDDGTIRTRIFYCDPMCSNQKGSLENVHHLIREICPKDTNLYKLGLTSQEKANLISSHINSYPKEKLNGKTSFQLADFLSPILTEKLYNFGLSNIDPDKVILKPYLLK